MKKNIFLSTVILLKFFPTSAQWTIVGLPNFSNVQADYIFSAVAPNGDPYVVYRDANQTATGTVKKFDGSSWVDVGSRFSTGYVYCTTMAFNSTGTPYVAYMDAGNSNRVTVMKFDGSNWVAVGAVGFTPSGASYTSIVIDGNGTPYVAFRDFAQSYRASVMKFNGTNWVYVGMPGFSENIHFGGVGYTSLAIDKQGTLYIAYEDDGDDFKASVMKFNGSSWVYVGAPAFSAWQTATTSLVLDSHGTPYVAYWDRANGGKATVMEFDGSNWISVGAVGLTPGVAQYTSLAIDKNDALYLTFEDHAQSDRASVMTFDGNIWQYVGSAGFSDSVAQFTTIAIDNNKGILYAAYEDLYNGTTQTPTYNATVMKFEISTGITEAKNNTTLTVYPNPTSGVFQINYSATVKGKVQLNIIDEKGKIVYTETFQGDYKGSTKFILSEAEGLTRTIDLGRKAKGIYFIEIISTDEKRTIKKIVLD